MTVRAAVTRPKSSGVRIRARTRVSPSTTRRFDPQASAVQTRPPTVLRASWREPESVATPAVTKARWRSRARSWSAPDPARDVGLIASGGQTGRYSSRSRTYDTCLGGDRQASRTCGSRPGVSCVRRVDGVRVLTLLDAYRLGGAETLIAQLARVSAAADLELLVLSLHGPSEERATLAPLLEQAGVVPQYLGARRTLDLPAFRRLVDHIRAADVDVVHAHLEMSITMGVPAARLAGVPAVSTFHHVHRPLTGRASARERLAVEVASRGAATVFVSQASLDSFAERYRPGK